MGASSATAMAELRCACWPVHQRLEKRLDIRTRFGRPGPYRAHLEKMWGFCASLECAVSAEAFQDALADYEYRRKLPLLTKDLVALGVPADEVSQLERCALTVSEDVAAAFGAVYVIEGATLGGRTLLPMVENQMGLSAAHGASFLASYGDDVDAMWSSFCASLDAFCADTETRATAARAAVRTFEALESWLVP